MSETVSRILTRIYSGLRNGGAGDVPVATLARALIGPDNQQLPSSSIINLPILTANTNVPAPGGQPVDGQTLVYRVVQDATGGRVITWDPVFVFPQANPASSLPTGANNKYEITFGWCVADNTWRARGVAGPY